MTATLPSSPPQPPDDLAHELASSGGTADRSFRTITYAAGGMVLIVLGLITWTMVTRSIPALRHMGLDFFTTKRGAPCTPR